MLGIIKNETLKAILNDNGIWESDDDIVEEYLNLNHNPDDAEGVYATLPKGVGSVINAAKELNCNYRHKKVPKLRKGEMG